jgi:uncharacterized membrane protein/protein-disulfide isomerase
MNRKAGWIVLGFALLGLVASAVASYVHYRILSDPTYTSFCDVTATVSCTEAYTSRFGTFRGVSVALFGLLWFAFATLLAVAGVTARPDVRESVPGYLFASSTLALAVVLYLGYASFVMLKVVCVVCLTTYAAVIGLFLVTGSAANYPMTSLPRRALHDLKVLFANPLAIAVTVLFLGGAVSTLAFFPREAAVAPGEAAPQVSQDQRTELERFMQDATRVPLVIPKEGAKVLIVKFNDYQCPACAQSYQNYKAIFAKYASQRPGEVRLVLKDFPLNPDCNPNLTQQVHPSACDAAVAVRLARQHGRGEQLEDWLYTHQQGMTPETVRQAAREIGQVTDYDAKYASTLESVKADIALGKQLNVNQTPTFFINGVKVDGAWAPQFFDQAIAYELQHAG